MILTEKGGLRVLTPSSNRYIIRIKGTNEYTDKVYLGKNGKVSNYEEVDKLTLEGYDIYDLIQDDINKMKDEYDNLIIQQALQLALIQLTL